MQKIRSFLPYFLGTIFVLTWWSAGLKGGIKPLSAPPVASLQKSLNSPDLSPLTQELLIKALAGNFPLMHTLIQTWDLEAEAASGSRLPLEDRVAAAKLLQSLKENPTPPSTQTVFPHSWAFATLALILLPENEIAGLPEGYTPFFPSKSLTSVSGELTPFLQEKKPKLVLAASYSHPRFLKTLSELDIPTYVHNPLFSLEELYVEIQNTSALINRPREGKLLTLFLKAAFLAIDNRAKRLPSRSHTLLLEKGLTYAMPTQKLLLGQLADRLELNRSFHEVSNASWRQPLTLEQIESLHPDHILLISETDEKPFDLPYKTTLIDSKYLNSLDPTLILGYLALYEALLP